MHQSGLAFVQYAVSVCLAFIYILNKAQIRADSAEDLNC